MSTGFHSAIDETGIEGLRWSNNYCAEAGPMSYTLVANPGPLVSDFHLWLRPAYEAFILHAGQDDRFTFVGDPDQRIIGFFVDCRTSTVPAGTAVKVRPMVELEFTPDARRVLTIPAGVAMYFEGLMHITVRSEPVWYAPAEPTPWQPGNDQIRISDETPPGDFPVIAVNTLPLPPSVLQSVASVVTP